MGPGKPGGRGLGASARREGTLEAEVPLALGLALHTLCGFASAQREIERGKCRFYLHPEAALCLSLLGLGQVYTSQETVTSGCLL